MSNISTRLVVGSILLLLAVIGFLFYQLFGPNLSSNQADSVNEELYGDLETPEGKIDPNPRIVADNLEVPWDIAFLPEGGTLVTERSGRLILVEDRNVTLVQEIEEVVQSGEGGLLGIALHPNFRDNRFIYLYMTVSVGRDPINNVVRYTYNDGSLTFNQVILEDIPGSTNHDGGRIEFGPDGYLYIATGDAGNPSLAQDQDSLAGKILRVSDDGSIPNDNPFNNAVYSLGHRNPQGLAWDNDGRLWSTEHGRSGIQSGLDEVNLIESGANYGWPDSEGDDVASGTRGPVWHSGSRNTWAPASAVYVGDSLFFGGLRGRALYEATLNGDEVISVTEHFKNEYGRIRTVRLGPDGYLYFTTSNRDGRGSPNSNDDKIIRIHPTTF